MVVISRGDAGAAKRAAFKRLWLSAYGGSNPPPHILWKNVGRRITSSCSQFASRVIYFLVARSELTRPHKL